MIDLVPAPQFCLYTVVSVLPLLEADGQIPSTLVSYASKVHLR